jgi:hypothetical protein
MFEKLFMDGIHPITRLKRNMKNSLMSIRDKIYLRKRRMITSKIYAGLSIHASAAL